MSRRNRPEQNKYKKQLNNTKKKCRIEQNRSEQNMLIKL